MASQLPQNTLFNAVKEGAYGLGAGLNKAEGRFKNIVPAIQQSQAPQAKVPLAERYKNLGAITSNFGSQTRGEAFHPGIDIAGPENQPIPAFASGKVVGARTGQVQGSPDYGNFLVIQDAQGNKWRYSHLNSIYKPVLGSEIKEGDIIGTQGRTGNVYSQTNSNPSHLDLRIKNLYDQYVNPMQFIGG